jgi:FkbM family methyltransferase
LKKIIFILKVFKGFDKFRFILLIIRLKYYWVIDKKLIYENTRVYNFELVIKNEAKKVHLRLQDVATFFEVFFKEIYKIDLPYCHTILDLGAHIGLATLYYEIHFPNSKIYSIEPAGLNFDLLRINACNAMLIKLAISNTQGNASLTLNPKGINCHLGESGEKVDTTTLMKIIEKYNINTIDIFKIDIEGAENLMFESIDQWKDKVKNIIMECHGNEREITSMLQNTNINYKIV